MDQENLAPFDDFLDLVAALLRFRPAHLQFLAVVAAEDFDGGMFGRHRLFLDRLFDGFTLLGEQRFAVGDRNLVIIRVDFVERQETVTVAAEIDERRLQRRLDARHFGQIDVTF